MAESVLVNHVTFHAVGHVVEALRYAAGHHAADPARAVDVAVNARAPVSLAGYCPFVRTAHTVVAQGPPEAALAHVTGPWDWVMHNPVADRADELRPYPWLGAYYETADRVLAARRGRGPSGDRSPGGPGYVPHQALRLVLPDDARERASALRAGDGPHIAVLPAGGTGSWLYPSPSSWVMILRALASRYPRATFHLTGTFARDGRSRSSFTPEALAAIMAGVPGARDAFGLPLCDQLALIEGCDLYLGPHSGFGMAVLTVGTPCLTISGGLWHEYLGNGVPFYSVIPDTGRYPAYGGLSAILPRPGRDGLRIPTASRERLREDLEEIVHGAELLIEGRLAYEDALRHHFTRLLAAMGDDPARLWSFDDVHHAYVPPAPGPPPGGRPFRPMELLTRRRYRDHL